MKSIKKRQRVHQVNNNWSGSLLMWQNKAISKANTRYRNEILRNIKWQTKPQNHDIQGSWHDLMADLSVHPYTCIQTGGTVRNNKIPDIKRQKWASPKGFWAKHSRQVVELSHSGEQSCRSSCGDWKEMNAFQDVWLVSQKRRPQEQRWRAGEYLCES